MQQVFKIPSPKTVLSSVSIAQMHLLTTGLQSNNPHINRKTCTNCSHLEWDQKGKLPDFDCIDLLYFLLPVHEKQPFNINGRTKRRKTLIQATQISLYFSASQMNVVLHTTMLVRVYVCVICS